MTMFFLKIATVTLTLAYHNYWSNCSTAAREEQFNKFINLLDQINVDKSLTSLREKARPEQTKILVFIHLRAIPLKIDTSWLSSSGQLIWSRCPV